MFSTINKNVNNNNDNNDQVLAKYVQLAHPTAYGGLSKIKHFYGKKKTLEEIKSSLANVNSYTLHREIKKPKNVNPYFIYQKRELIQMDLIQMKKWNKINLTQHNKQHNYILTAIDVYTRKAWVCPILRKKGDSTLEAIKLIFKQIGPDLDKLMIDNGTEFCNKNVKAYLKRRNIKVIYTKTALKCVFVERFNRTIQQLIYKYMTQNNTYTYIDVLQQLLSTYNNRIHRSLKYSINGKSQYLTPNQAEDPKYYSILSDIHTTKYNKIINKNKNKKPNYRVGDFVRIAKEKTVFSRSYLEQFKDEIFEIIKINTRLPVTTYILRSVEHLDEIEGGFYPGEIQKLGRDIFKIEKIISELKNRRGQITHYFVKWIGFNKKFNSYISVVDFEKKYQ